MVNGAPDVFSTSSILVQFGVRVGLEMPLKVRCCESGAGPSFSGTDRNSGGTFCGCHKRTLPHQIITKQDSYSILEPM